jgi:hypothetical protein
MPAFVQWQYGALTHYMAEWATKRSPELSQRKWNKCVRGQMHYIQALSIHEILWVSIASSAVNLADNIRMEIVSCDHLLRNIWVRSDPESSQNHFLPLSINKCPENIDFPRYNGKGQLGLISRHQPMLPQEVQIPFCVHHYFGSLYQWLPMRHCRCYSDPIVVWDVWPQRGISWDFDLEAHLLHGWDLIQLSNWGNRTGEAFLILLVSMFRTSAFRRRAHMIVDLFACHQHSFNAWCSLLEEWSILAIKIS